MLNVRIAPDSVSLVSFYLIKNTVVDTKPLTKTWKETDNTLVNLNLFVNKEKSFSS